MPNTERPTPALRLTNRRSWLRSGQTLAALVKSCSSVNQHRPGAVMGCSSVAAHREANQQHSSMKRLSLLSVSISIGICVAMSQSFRYHTLEFTASGPVISQRCVGYNEIRAHRIGFVRETVDKFQRCVKLEFFDEAGMPLREVDFPPVVTFAYTDSSMVETLLEKSGELFSKEQFVRPNSIEYVIIDSSAIRIRSKYNSKRVGTSIQDSTTAEFESDFLIFSGCTRRTNRANNPLVF
jgi:hypothetical protein